MNYSRDTMDDAILGDGFRNIEYSNGTPEVTITGSAPFETIRNQNLDKCAHLRITDMEELFRGIITGDLCVWRSGGMEVQLNNHRYRVEYPNGDTKWYCDHKLHREDGPAVELADGTKQWYINNVCHREDGPAFIYPDGTEVWLKNGVKHRVDGPAWISPTGHEEWFIEGKRHREDGPAYVSSRGDERWYFNGKLHRLDGPASESASGVNSWIVHGREHRTDGPAIEFEDGSYQWMLDNEYVDKKTVINHVVQRDLKTLLMEKAVHHGCEALIGKYLP
jgi:hypothetical protein